MELIKTAEKRLFNYIPANKTGHSKLVRDATQSGQTDYRSS